ncbi:MAG: hypothetical protein H6814_07465 [Phycisphaeraceae bacterium]|nr:hypothetical protein [Phycisphaeraceae bacterium]
MNPIPPAPGDEISRELLIRQIEAAFRNVDRIGATSLHQASAIDDYASDREIEEAGRLDRDKHWTEIPGELLEQHCNALGFFDVKGWVYHLPAYMRWSLHRADGGHDNWMKDVPVSALGPPLQDSSNKRRRTPPEPDPNFEALTSGQKRACARFLRYKGWQEMSAEAMMYYQDYWRRFDT